MSVHSPRREKYMSTSKTISIRVLGEMRIFTIEEAEQLQRELAEELRISARKHAVISSEDGYLTRSALNKLMHQRHLDPKTADTRADRLYKGLIAYVEAIGSPETRCQRCKLAGSEHCTKDTVRTYAENHWWVTDETQLDVRINDIKLIKEEDFLKRNGVGPVTVEDLRQLIVHLP